MSITLAQLEQEVGRRVGPYYAYMVDQQVPATSTASYANFPALRSSISLDNVTNLWMLRRGVYGDGTSLSPALPAIDRQRLVFTYDPSSGHVATERSWGIIPQPGEMIEFHHLDPAQELRIAVLAGLRRCFYADSVQIASQLNVAWTDLTAQYAWLTQPWQVQRCWWAWYGWSYYPRGDLPFDVYMQANHLILNGTGSYGMVPGALWAEVSRPAWSHVNGADSTTGPTGDSDTLDVDLDYAAAAGHIEAWHHFPRALASASASGTQATQQQAAAEFTRQVGFWGPRRPAGYGFHDAVYGVSNAL